ncbi:methyltransferase family protein [Deinococcus radiopugnans]|uniref:Isoprenylcysteine carboxylmethyltransferase family protein n=1 Tax=Deinococcus radiopugnans ATCC 19172 TaxID=585398 RepID=A0A5C4XW90_9DEIO|nr:isoprenylcysteine carboxylmethyltransferase family protein [Deinococcus radiopugnans]MBB6018361.1 protein-S-isoprenylcysteine O-methyltransferase Ste14 [Deinococcus radiopugnans ATCC 19172]TNM67961.1 isoprenylcysteine carboxylmethyltransferase family protein [Deinococcus radiopugnans ATCC 19172]
MTLPSRLQRFRQRGGVFVAAQFVLIGLVALRGRKCKSVGILQKAAGLSLMALGGAIVASGGRSLGRNLSALPEPLDGAQLVTTGLYGHIRHPIYSGLVALGLGWGVLRGSPGALGWTAALATLFHFKASREETALLARFPEYAAYRKRTKRFVPGVV